MFKFSTKALETFRTELYVLWPRHVEVSFLSYVEYYPIFIASSRPVVVRIENRLRIDQYVRYRYEYNFYV